jgi:hypothetical protein
MIQTPARKLVMHFLVHPPSGVTLELQPDISLSHGKEIECKNRVALLNIKREGGEPGTGALAMRELCARADELRVEIVLSVTPKALPLLAYYANFHFEWMPSRDEYHAMRRRPRAMEGRVDNPTIVILSALRIAARHYDEQAMNMECSPQARVAAEYNAKEARQLLMMCEARRTEIILRSGV